MNKKLMCAAFGLPDDATDEAINAALSQFIDSKKASTTAATDVAARITAAAAEAADVATKKLTGIIETSTKALTAATDRIAALEKDRTTAGVSQLQAKLLSEGRITAAQQADVAAYAEVMGLPQATAFYSKLPVVVALGERGIAAGADAATETTESANKKLDEATDALIKANPSLKRSEARLQAMASNVALVKALDGKTNTISSLQS